MEIEQRMRITAERFDVLSECFSLGAKEFSNQKTQYQEKSEQIEIMRVNKKEKILKDMWEFIEHIKEVKGWY